MSDILRTIKTVGGAILAIALVVAVLAAVYGIAPGIIGDKTVFEPAERGFDNGTVVDDTEAPLGLSVSLSTQTAVQLDGGGYVADPTDDSTFASGDWTVAAVVEPADQFNDAATYTIYAANNESVFVAFENGSYSARYDDGSTTAYVDGAADTSTRTAIVVAYNADTSTLTLYLDGTQVDSATTTINTVAKDVPVRWRGSIDEVRVYEAALSGSQAAKYAADPVAPIAPSSAAARLPFNDNRLQTVYYATGDAAFVGSVSTTSGVSGDGLDRGTDYALSTDPVRITATDGGDLDNAPIVFVSWQDGAFGGLLASVFAVGSSALGLLVVAVLVLAANAVWREFSGGGF